MTGPELCPKCKGLHFKTSPCIARVTKSAAHKEIGTSRSRTANENLPADTIPEQSSASQIAEGLKEALEVVKGNTKPYAVHKRGVGRPKTITDMRAYKAQKQREYRAKLKAQKGER